MKHLGYEKIDPTKDESLDRARKKIINLMDESIENHKSIIKCQRRIKHLLTESIQDKKKINHLQSRIQTYESVLAIVIRENKSMASKSKK